MRIVLIPLLAALVGAPFLSPSLTAAEGDVPRQTDGERGVTPGNDLARRQEAQRQRDETQRRRDAGQPQADRDRRVAPGNDQVRREEEAQRQGNDNQRLNNTGDPMNVNDREAMDARLQERANRLKTERPELFNRLDLDRNGELSNEELRRPRESFRQRQQARQDAGEQARPVQPKGAVRTLPPAASPDNDVDDYLFTE